MTNFRRLLVSIDFGFLFSITSLPDNNVANSFITVIIHPCFFLFLPALVGRAADLMNA
jgi:hypothetical protein